VALRSRVTEDGSSRGGIRESAACSPEISSPSARWVAAVEEEDRARRASEDGFDSDVRLATGEW
jgi:hypothetical protein